MRQTLTKESVRDGVSASNDRTTAEGDWSRIVLRPNARRVSASSYVEEEKKNISAGLFGGRCCHWECG